MITMSSNDLCMPYCLHVGDTIICQNNEQYTVTDTPYNGHTSILYPVKKWGNQTKFLLKMCFPCAQNILFRQEPENILSDCQNIATKQWLEELYINLHRECQIGQELANKTDRVVAAREVVTMVSFVSSDHIYNGFNQPMLLLEEKSQNGAFLQDILQAYRTANGENKFFYTSSLPNVYTTICIIEQVLYALEAIHRQGYLHGNIHASNIYFRDFCLQNGKIGFGCLTDFSNARKFCKASESTVDIYSLGCLFFYLLTGNDLSNGQKKLFYFTREQLANISCKIKLGSEIEYILHRALQSGTCKCYGSAAEMLAEVQILKKKLQPPIHPLLLDDLTNQENFYFLGRTQECNELECFYLEKQNPIVLYGFGGMGKTELAIEFAKQMKKKYVIETYFVTFAGSFYDTVVGPIAKHFGGYELVDAKGKKKTNDLIYHEVMKLLAQLDEDSILIIDNVDAETRNFDELCTQMFSFQKVDLTDNTYDELCKLPIRILLTTRSMCYQGIEVKQLSKDNLKNLMRHYCGGKISESQIESLITAVDGHTLAVELIGRMLVHSKQHSITAELILERLREGQMNLFPEEIESTKDRVLQKQRILDHIYNLFDMTNLPIEEQHLMTTAIFLPDEGMDYALFASSQPSFEQEWVEHLTERGWLKWSVKDRIKIHPLVREACQQKIKTEGCMQEESKIIDSFLENLWYKVNLADYNADMLQQLSDVYPRAVNRWEGLTYHILKAGNVFMLLGDCNRAIQYYSWAVKIGQNKFQDNPFWVASAYYGMGDAYNFQFKPEKSLECYKKALEIGETCIPKDNIYLALFYHRVGVGYLELEKSLEAKFYCQEALNLAEKILPKAHFLMAPFYNGLGNVYRLLGENEMALNLLLHSLEIVKQGISNNHPELGKFYLNVCFVAQQLEEYYDLAIECGCKARQIIENINLSNKWTEECFFTYIILGGAYCQKKDWDKALEAYKNAEKLVGALSLKQSSKLLNSVIECHYIMGVIYCALGNFENTLVYAQKAVCLMEQKSSIDVSNAADIYYLLGAALSARKKLTPGELEKAVVCLEKAWETYRKEQPWNVPHRIECWQILKWVRAKKKINQVIKKLI